MRIFLVLVGMASLLVGCAGKKTVNDHWDSSPLVCDGFGSDACTPLPQELPESRRVEAGLKRAIDGDDLQYYRVIQKDATLSAVFIHGCLGHASDFRRQFSRPPAGFNLLAYDRPGFGRSTNRHEADTLDFNAKVAATWLNVEPKQPVVLVGHSYGGPIALLAALANPGRVKGLVLISPILDPAQAAPFKVQSLLDSAGLVPGVLKQTNRELIKLQSGLEKVMDQVAALQIPVEWVYGGKDDIVNPSNLAFFQGRLAKLGKSALLHAEECPECGHRIPDLNPERLNAALDRIRTRLK